MFVSLILPVDSCLDSDIHVIEGYGVTRSVSKLDVLKSLLLLVKTHREDLGFGLMLYNQVLSLSLFEKGEFMFSIKKKVVSTRQETHRILAYLTVSVYFFLC